MSGPRPAFRSNMSPGRSLLPREHGAYAQLAAPLLSALLARVPTLAAMLLATGAISAFLANEPLLVLLGHRGRRLQETESRRARTRLIWLASFAFLTGASGLLLGGPRVLAGTAIVAAPALALVVFACRRAQHSVGGETLAAVALPGLAVPIASASGISLVDSLLLWTAWSAAYAASVMAVHRVIARHRQSATVVDWILPGSFIALMIVAIVLARFADVVLVALPGLAASTLIVLYPPRATRLRAIGIALVVMSGISVSLAVVTL